MDQDTGAPFIVVGVDGCDSSKDALRWAVAQARLTGAAVHAVAAWNFPTSYGWAPYISDVDRPTACPATRARLCCAASGWSTT